MQISFSEFYSAPKRGPVYHPPKKLSFTGYRSRRIVFPDLSVSSFAVRLLHRQNKEPYRREQKQKHTWKKYFQYPANAPHPPKMNIESRTPHHTSISSNCTCSIRIRTPEFATYHDRFPSIHNKTSTLQPNNHTMPL